MNWHYFACNRCGHTFRTTIDNPDKHLACAACVNQYFNELSKSEYDEARKKAPLPK